MHQVEYNAHTIRLSFLLLYELRKVRFPEAMLWKLGLI